MAKKCAGPRRSSGHDTYPGGGVAMANGMEAIGDTSPGVITVDGEAQ